jgi:hypothetical protein
VSPQALADVVRILDWLASSKSSPDAVAEAQLRLRDLVKVEQQQRNKTV